MLAKQTSLYYYRESKNRNGNYRVHGPDSELMSETANDERLASGSAGGPTSKEETETESRLPQSQDITRRTPPKSGQPFPFVEFPPMICQQSTAPGEPAEPLRFKNVPSSPMGAQLNGAHTMKSAELTSLSARFKPKKRGNAMKIIDPATNEEMNVQEVFDKWYKDPRNHQNPQTSVLLNLDQKRRSVNQPVPPANPFTRNRSNNKTIDNISNEEVEVENVNGVSSFPPQPQEGRTSDAPGSLVSMEQVQAELTSLMKQKKPYGKVLEFILTKVGNEVENLKFIEVLITAICDVCISDVDYSFDQYSFKRYEKLIRRFSNNRESCELQCLNTIRNVVVKLNHPEEIMNNIFDLFLQNGVISSQSFLKWRNTEKATFGNNLLLLNKLNPSFSTLEGSHPPQRDNSIPQENTLTSSEFFRNWRYKKDESQAKSVSSDRLNPVVPTHKTEGTRTHNATGHSSQDKLVNNVGENPFKIELTRPEESFIKVTEPLDSNVAFGQMCAAELRQLKLQENKVKLKRLIMEAIYDVAEADASGKIFCAKK